LPASLSSSTPARRTPSIALPLVSIVEAERDLILRALAATGGNKTRAAQILGISRKQLYEKIAKYRCTP
jgi:DNA-binding NtrC family response regulator